MWFLSEYTVCYYVVALYVIVFFLHFIPGVGWGGCFNTENTSASYCLVRQVSEFSMPKTVVTSEIKLKQN